MDATDYSVEIWKDVPDWEGFYRVSSHGRVQGIRITHNWLKPRILKASPDSNGYPRVALSRNKTVKYIQVHQLVAQCFLPPDPERPHVNHIDGIKIHCVPSNLEWCTIPENNKHALEHGLNMICAKGELKTTAKLSNDDVRQIREMLKNGIKQHIIAAQFGTTRVNIAQIKRGFSWKHLT